MKNIKLILLTVVILLCFKQLNATSLTPTSYGSYYSGIKLTGKQIVFSGSGSYDNDAQANGYTPRWEWDFQYNGSSFVVRANTTSSLTNWTYTTKGAYTVAVRYWDNDNQCGNVYTFTIKIAELETLYYVKDHLGNIRVTVDNAATIKGYDDYDPYGLQLDGRSMNNANGNAKYKYSSKELDKENGFNCYYFGARYYDPAIGRWLAVDPLDDKYQGWSPYNFTLDNPVKNIDPDGRWVWGVVIGAGLEYAEQSLKTNNWGLEGKDWGKITKSAVVGGLSAGIGSIAKAYKLSALAESSLQVALNVVDGQVDNVMDGKGLSAGRVGKDVAVGTVMEGAKIFGAKIAKSANPGAVEEIKHDVNKAENIANSGRARPTQLNKLVNAQNKLSGYGKDGPVATAVNDGLKRGLDNIVKKWTGQ